MSIDTPELRRELGRLSRMVWRKELLLWKIAVAGAFIVGGALGAACAGLLLG